MTLGTLGGALAGAAGTTALNGATYLDMALRARPASESTSDVPLKLLGIGDPGSWAVEDWASDAVPHLLYGIVTTAVLRTGEA